MPTSKKGRKSGHKAPPSFTSLERAKDELLIFCNNQDAQFFMDQLFGYALSSELFITELDDFSRTNSYNFHSLVKNLLAEVFEEDRQRRKGKR